jgi:hypothetical protein
MKDQPDEPRKVGPFAAVAVLALIAIIALAFVWGVAAAIKWV